MLAANPQWVREHDWVLPTLLAGCALCGILAAAFSEWVRRLRQRLPDQRPLLSQETRGSHSPVVGRIGRIGSGAHVNIGVVGGIRQSAEDPGDYPRVELGCTAANTVPHIDQLCSLRNRGADALDVRLDPIETVNYILASRPIDRILGGEAALMAFTGTPKRSDLPVAAGAAAVIMIIRDICSVSGEREIRLTIQLRCSDVLQQHHYVTTQELSYDTAGNRISSLEYKGVKKID